MPRVNSLPFIWVVSLLIHAPALFAQFLLVPSSNVSQSGEIRFSTPAGNEITPLQPVTFDPVVTVIVNPPSFIGPRTPALTTAFCHFSRKLEQFRWNSFFFAPLTNR
jgi:hypothetical protein